MKASEFLIKTQKKPPKDEISLNAKLLIQAGFIDKLMAGVYTFLPLGLKVLKKIENIIRDEINKIGGIEILMPALHPSENWKKTRRWTTMKDLFKIKTKNNREYALGPTHEEIIVPLAKKFIFSYKDLPFYLYQFQTKFRNELRPKSGLLRGREFLMKDLYSFHKDEKDLDNYYERVKKAYFKIFKRCKLAKKTYLTLASGGTFSKYSHEFQTITKAGEDIIYLCKKCNLAMNKEIILEKKEKCFQCGNKQLKEEKGIEVGNIFKLGFKFSKAFNLTYRDKDGKEKLVVMGCYGIGLPRLMGAVVEVFNDEKGIIWPEQLTPFKVHLIEIPEKEKKIKKTAEKLYQSLKKAKIEVLYDERQEISAGEKFAQADFIGCSWQIIVGKKTLAKNKFELKKRDTNKIEILSLAKIIKKLKNEHPP